MKKLLFCVVFTLVVLQCVMAQEHEVKELMDKAEKTLREMGQAMNSASVLAPAPVLLQLGMTVFPALLYKLL
ncbi:hypothetical protein SKAU_G00330820 [Synaphobranchus kaupii]|uniref:Uncharacterized protein n=1 Tax=Synaphobranchus kaupii TaxID=118154 RepID=A0A9Q1EL31_SYNKA|nr:hypothetical protein SKAU_G00330820 [Synaphobranchus kaupii]